MFVLPLLDLSAAFVSVDHATLLQRLRISYGTVGSVIDWFNSYRSDRSQYVRLPASMSTESAVLYGVAQGSVLGPVLFLLYTAGLLQVPPAASTCVADDTQIYGFCHPYEADALQLRLSACVDDVSLWMTFNRLQLNPAKTEILWCASARRQQQIPIGQVCIGDTFVCPVTAVRDLGVHPPRCRRVHHCTRKINSQIMIRCTKAKYAVCTVRYRAML